MIAGTCANREPAVADRPRLDLPGRRIDLETDQLVSATHRLLPSATAKRGDFSSPGGSRWGG